jgi:hypothetical protein
MHETIHVRYTYLLITANMKVAVSTELLNRTKHKKAKRGCVSSGRRTLKHFPGLENVQSRAINFDRQCHFKN